MEHKHCRKCGNMIVPSKYDEDVSDLLITDSMVFHKDICYANGFCSTCVGEYGLDRLMEWFYRGERI